MAHTSQGVPLVVLSGQAGRTTRGRPATLITHCYLRLDRKVRKRTSRVDQRRMEYSKATEQLLHRWGATWVEAEYGYDWFRVHLPGQASYAKLWIQLFKCHLPVGTNGVGPYYNPRGRVIEVGTGFGEGIPRRNHAETTYRKVIATSGDAPLLAYSLWGDCPRELDHLDDHVPDNWSIGTMGDWRKLCAKWQDFGATWNTIGRALLRCQEGSVEWQTWNERDRILTDWALRQLGKMPDKEVPDSERLPGIDTYKQWAKANVQAKAKHDRQVTFLARVRQEVERQRFTTFLSYVQDV